MLDQTIRHGIFKEELKNRFLCLVEVDGEDTFCYIPSSCRLSNFVDLTGRDVLLLPITSPNSRTKYSVYALLEGNAFILLNMSKANEVVANCIKSRRFSLLGKRTHIRREYKIGDYKSDLYIEDTKTIVEIKSVLSFAKDGRAQFPSVYSQRAIEQLLKLSRLIDEGFNVCYIFVSLNRKTKQLIINEEIREYRDAFNCCVEKGMQIKGVSLSLINGKAIICSNLLVTV